MSPSKGRKNGRRPKGSKPRPRRGSAAATSSSIPQPLQDDRRHLGALSTTEALPLPDTRTATQKDRDRILYTSAYRRLAGVTQVVGAVEGHVFHNRLTHTGEVAQIARRLAERFAHGYKKELAAKGLTIDAEAAEAAALAHDLGHPPFGHVAEAELNRLVSQAGNSEGYEGNAQSFRILTRLATHRPRYQGLNLTRRTLNAVLKYPWLRGDGDPKKPKKFGAYRTERADFDFARDGCPSGSPSLEAMIMDHADAVAYSVHDLDDFYRAGLIPLQEVVQALPNHIKSLVKSGRVEAEFVQAHQDKLERWFRARFNRGRYAGDKVQRVALQQLTADLIHDFVMEATLDFTGSWPRLIVPDLRRLEIELLQHLVFRHVIDNSRLASQQWGQRQIIIRLFNTYSTAIEDPHEADRLVPGAYREELATLGAAPADGEPDRKARVARLAADIVAGFTDDQAVRLDRRLSGVEPGSVTELVDG